ncbi:MAG: nucleoside hydrolase [Actinomycetia bacterium]|nr:nucleoside hydrolase [Actinomycetes bacterium]
MKHFPAVALLGATLVLSACATTSSDDPTPGTDTSSTPIVFSTDMAMGLTSDATNGTAAAPSDIDDSWAYALAATQGALDIRGVVVTMGNNMAAPEVEVARQTVAAMETDVPVVMGATVWLDDAKSVDDTPIPTDGCVNDGVRFLRDEAERTPGLIILAIGPMTDVACLATQFPEQADNLGGVVALTGSAPGPLLLDGKKVRDFNYVMDPRALQVVLDETDVDFTAIMFGVSSQGPIKTQEIEQLGNSSDPRAAFFGTQSTPMAKYWAEVISNKKPIWDAAVVWYQLNPQHMKCAQMGYKLKVGPPLQQQGEVYDYFDPKFTESKRQVTACTEWSSPAAIDQYTAATWQAVGGSGSPTG